MSSLPYERDSFVGRDSEMLEVAMLLGSSPVVTIAGPPGVGKTRLALEIARRLGGRYPGGTWVVGLSEVAAAAAVPEAVAAALGVFESSSQGATQATISRLRGRPALLLLDNTEHVLPACAAFVREVVGGCDRLSVLVTSRQPLEVEGEQVFACRPLPVTAGGAEDTPAPSPAVRLFLNRAREVRPDFHVGNDILPAVTDLCRRLDGLPLAIELAAARVETLSVAEIVARLDQRLDLVAGDAVAVEPRHRSLSLALEWSYNLLSAGEQRLLRRLSIFAGSFTVAAAAAVVGTGTPEQVAQGIRSLVAKWLVAADDSGGHQRYRLLETVRQFGAGLLTDSEEAAVTSAHLGWFTGMAAGAEERITGPAQLAALQDLDADYADLRGALERAVAGGHHEAALAIAGGLSFYWRLRGRYSEGKRWLDVALDRAPDAPAGLRATALWGAGIMALVASDNARSVDLLEASRALAGEIGERQREARALLLLGNAFMTSDFPAALDHLARAAEVAGEIGDGWCESHANALIGRVRSLSGDRMAARHDLEKAVVIARAGSDPQALRLALATLGEMALQHGRLAEAEALLKESLYAARKLREPYFVTQTLLLLGTLALRRGDADAAEALFDEAAKEVVDRSREQAQLMMARGSLARFRGDHRRAMSEFGEAAALLRESGASPPAVLAALALELVEEGQIEEAAAVVDEAWSSVAATPFKDSRALVLDALGELHVRKGELDAGVARLQEALRAHFDAGRLHDVVSSLIRLGGVALKSRRHQYAARVVGAADSLRRSAGYGLSPADAARVDGYRSVLGRALGADKFEAAWTDGSSMPVDEAVSYALRQRGSPKKAALGWVGLTKTERKVAALVANGLSNSEIAANLSVSTRTVHAHLANVFAKLGVSSRTQLARISHERTAGNPDIYA